MRRISLITLLVCLCGLPVSACRRHLPDQGIFEYLSPPSRRGLRAAPKLPSPFEPFRLFRISTSTTGHPRSPSGEAATGVHSGSWILARDRSHLHLPPETGHSRPASASISPPTSAIASGSRRQRLELYRGAAFGKLKLDARTAVPLYDPFQQDELDDAAPPCLSTIPPQVR